MANVPNAQMYWFVKNEQIGLAYWDGEDLDGRPDSGDREILVTGRGSFDTATVKPSSGSWVIDSRIPDELAEGITEKIIADGYLNRPETSAETMSVYLQKYRIYNSKYEDKTRKLKQYYGKNRRTSVGHIRPYDLR